MAPTAQGCSSAAVVDCLRAEGWMINRLLEPGKREKREKMEPSSNRKEPGQVYQTTINDQETSKHPKSHST